MIAALTFCLILILVAVTITLENRVARLTDRLRNVERALSSMNKKYND